MVSKLQERFSKGLARQRKASKTKKEVSRAENSIRKNLDPLTPLISKVQKAQASRNAKATQTPADRAKERQKKRKQKIAAEANKSRKK